jgi:hypothetical protein
LAVFAPAGGGTRDRAQATAAGSTARPQFGQDVTGHDQLPNRPGLTGGAPGDPATRRPADFGADPPGHPGLGRTPGHRHGEPPACPTTQAVLTPSAADSWRRGTAHSIRRPAGLHPGRPGGRDVRTSWLPRVFLSRRRRSPRPLRLTGAGGSAQLLELTVNVRRTPERGGGLHLPDQPSDVRSHGWLANPLPT